MIFARGASGSAVIDGPTWWGSVPTYIALGIGAAVFLGMVVAIVWCAVTAGHGAEAPLPPPREGLTLYRIDPDECCTGYEVPPRRIVVPSVTVAELVEQIEGNVPPAAWPKEWLPYVEDIEDES